MAQHIRDLGSFESIQQVWTALPGGGMEGDYLTINGNPFAWNKYIRQWQNDTTVINNPARETQTHDGDMNIGNDARIGGNLVVIGNIINDSIKNGLSAFELAVKGGYQGTEEQWLNSLIGKSAYQIWLEQAGNAGKGIEYFLAWMKDTKAIKGPKYIEDENLIDTVNERMTIFYVNNGTSYKVVFVDEQGYTHTLANRIGDITNYAGIYDVSADNELDGGIPKTYGSLSDAIADIAGTAKKGGMTIKYIGTDGKYHQYRYTLVDTSINQFTNVYNWTTDGIHNGSQKEDIDLSQVETTNLGYSAKTNKITSMTTGYASKFVPIESGYTYIIRPKDSSYRVSFATFKVKPTAANQDASIGNECVKQYGYRNVVGENGESKTIKITESSYLYIRVDTSVSSPSCVGSICKVTDYDSILDDENKIMPITKSENIKYNGSSLATNLDKLLTENAITADISLSVLYNIKDRYVTDEINFAKGKKYRIVVTATSSIASDTFIRLNDSPDSSANVIIDLVTIPSGEFIGEIIYECVNDDLRYFSIHSSVNISSTFNIKVIELGIATPYEEIEDVAYTNETFTLEQGGISNGSKYDSTARVRVPEQYIEISGRFFVTVGSNYYLGVLFYDTNKTFIKATPWIEEKYKDSWTGYISLTVRHHDNSDISEDEDTGLTLHRDLKQVIPSEEAIIENVKQEIGNTGSLKEVGVNGGGVSSNFTSSFESGAINGNADNTDTEDFANDACIRTPKNNPISVGVGILHCVFHIQNPKPNSPWSKPYYYKDGVYVDAGDAGMQIDDGTVWEKYCDGSFNEIRFRVYVTNSSTANNSSIECSFVYNGSGLLGKANNDKRGITERNLHIGKIIQSSSGGYGAANDDSGNYVCMTDALQLPYNGVTIRVKSTKDIRVKLSLSENGNNDFSTNTNYKWLRNNDIYTIPQIYNYYHLCFGVVNYAGTVLESLSLSRVQQLIEDGDICITYDVLGDDNILHSRQDAEILVRALKLNGNSVIICHTSDQHGNVYGLSDVYKFAEYIGSDVLVNTGDVYSFSPENGCEFASNLAKESTIPTLVCVGNHDAFNVNGESDIRTGFIDKFKTPSYVFSNNNNNATYYYYDLSSKHIRFIVLNSSQTGYASWNDIGCMTQDQIDFLVDALSGTPDGYGVIVCFHIPFGRKENWFVDNNYGFMNEIAEARWVKELPFARPIADIIDAYIGKTSFSVSYTNGTGMNEGSNTQVSKSGKFTNPKGKFICYLTGHTHQDRVGFLKDTSHPQLCLNITCTANCDWQANPQYEDLPRQGDGVCRNAFNIYVIDTDVIHIIRVGSDINKDCVERKVAHINYLDME